MRRKHSSIRVRRFFPLFFYYECDNCQYEFKREWGWLAWRYLGLYGPYKKIICKECAKTKEEALALVSNRPDKPKGFPPSPPLVAE